MSQENVEIVQKAIAAVNERTRRRRSEILLTGTVTASEARGVTHRPTEQQMPRQDHQYPAHHDQRHAKEQHDLIDAQRPDLVPYPQAV